MSFHNPLNDRLGEEFFKTLPREAGVYTFFDSEDRPLYIGKADDLRRRLRSYQAAKPGVVGDHIIEMIEHATSIRFERHKTGKQALKREAELIRSVKPPYNIALNWDVNYLHIGTRSTPRKKERGWSDIEFRLSHFEIGDGFTRYGCFRHRGRVKAGYSALLRLLYAAYCPRERFLLPAKICRSSPAYQYVIRMPEEVLPSLDAFLEGRNRKLLGTLFTTLIEKPHLPKQLYIPLRRDFDLAKEFFSMGPRDTRLLAIRAGLRKGRISQEKMDRLSKSDFERTFAAKT